MKKKRIHLILLVFLFLIGLFILYHFKFYRIQDKAMLPILDQNELVLIKKTGTKHLKQKDIIAFYDTKLSDVSLAQKPIKVSRLIAFPGDTIWIEEKVIYVNGKQINLDSPIFMKYRITTKSEFDVKWLEHHDYDTFNEIATLTYELHCTPETAAEIARLNEVVAVRLLYDLRGKACYDVFPVSEYNLWNKDFFGPFVIPRKGDVVNLTFRNFDLYKRIINVHEKNVGFVKNQQVYINEEQVKSYCFKQNYYFVINDNRDYLTDSRSFGLVPKDHILGKIK
jgi:signal peptidase I